MVKKSFVLTVMLTVMALSLPGSHAASTPDLKRVHFKKTEDHFYNFDFTTLDAASADDPPSDKVDWGMSLLFKNGATVNRVHNRLRDMCNEDDFGICRRFDDDHGAPMYARVNDGYGWVVASAVGRKGFPCAIFNTTAHYRVYADWQRYMSSFRPDLGHYVVGTIHRDHNHCPGSPDQWSGKSEAAEHSLAIDVARKWGARRVNEHSRDWENADARGNVDGHWWQSDGWATSFRMPRPGETF